MSAIVFTAVSLKDQSVWYLWYRTELQLHDDMELKWFVYTWECSNFSMWENILSSEINWVQLSPANNGGGLYFHSLKIVNFGVFEDCQS